MLPRDSKINIEQLKAKFIRNLYQKSPASKLTELIIKSATWARGNVRGFFYIQPLPDYQQNAVNGYGNAENVPQIINTTCTNANSSNKPTANL